MEKIDILVPTDFTPVGDCALQHAVRIAQIADVKIHLLHLVKREKDIAKAESEMEAAIERVGTADVEVVRIVRIGDIFTDIVGVGRMINAKMIFMGTHGAKGLQKVFGSYAMKVISESDIPFVVVQKKDLREHGFRKIVMPLDLSKESLQSLKTATAVAKDFKSDVHIFVQKINDAFLQNRVKRNVVVAQKYLKENNIGYAVKVAAGKENFGKEVLEYAASIDADLISIVNDNDTLLKLFGGFEQQIIANDAHIPALIMNAVVISKTGSFIFST